MLERATQRELEVLQPRYRIGKRDSEAVMGKVNQRRIKKGLECLVGLVLEPERLLVVISRLAEGELIDGIRHGRLIHII